MASTNVVLFEIGRIPSSQVIDTLTLRAVSVPILSSEKLMLKSSPAIIVSLGNTKFLRVNSGKFSSFFSSFSSTPIKN